MGLLDLDDQEITLVQFGLSSSQVMRPPCIKNPYNTDPWIDDRVFCVWQWKSSGASSSIGVDGLSRYRTVCCEMELCDHCLSMNRGKPLEFDDALELLYQQASRPVSHPTQGIRCRNCQTHHHLPALDGMSTNVAACEEIFQLEMCVSTLFFSKVHSIL